MEPKILIGVAAAVVVLGGGGYFAYNKFATLRTPEQKMAYALGADIGARLASQKVPLDSKALGMAVSDVMSGSKVRLTEAELNEAYRSYQEALQKLAVQVAQKNHDTAQAFFKTNGQRKEVTAHASGMQYEVLKQGTGAKVEASDTVVANYRGTTLDGAEFDASARQGKPAELKVDQLIPGLKIGLPLMKEGSVYRFFVPSELAYKDEARPGITPLSALIFEIEVVKRAPAAASRKEKK